MERYRPGGHRICLIGRVALTALLLPFLVSVSSCSSSHMAQENAFSPIITEVEELPYDGPLARMVVGRILDKRADDDEESIDVAALTAGIREVLTTALFNSGRYIILEREHLDDLYAEQAFQAEQGESIALGSGVATLEGAELLLVGAVTDFNSGDRGGVAFPIPIFFNRNTDIALLNVQMRRGRVALELRLLDITTGRVVAALAVEGTSWKAGAALSSIYTAHGSISLPGLLSLYKNTPIEQAIQEMASEASRAMVANTPVEYLRH